MAKQSKNRVKLKQQYRKIGIIPKSAIIKIGEFFDIPNNAKTIRSNPSNVLKHNEEHLKNSGQALVNQISSFSTTETVGENGIGLGEIKEGVANNAPKAACPTCPLTTQHTIKQDARALANGHCKNTSFFVHRNCFTPKNSIKNKKTSIP